ncbi:MAG: PhoH family protein [Clostridia bacterium]|nr:PhoH family protein [Clostridia bacterium]
MFSKKVDISLEEISKIFGALDENAALIEKAFDVTMKLTGEEFTVKGDEENVENTLVLISKLKKAPSVDKNRIRLYIDMIKSGNASEIESLNNDVVAITARGKQIVCKTLGQRAYVKAIRKNTVVFGIGPAGTGKTYLAVALAVMAYKSGDIDKIILTRPALEAGEKLGFLPGDLQTKVDPYLRPLYDALNEMFGTDNYLKLIERNIIEIAPLAYMRGRTLSRSFIILDEAQNTTKEQMKMFLTRLGDGSKMVITGDVTQIDLPRGVDSGLKDAVSVLNGVEDISFVTLTDKDVVRHELVQRIVLAYEKQKRNVNE